MKRLIARNFASVVATSLLKRHPQGAFWEVVHETCHEFVLRGSVEHSVFDKRLPVAANDCSCAFLVLPTTIEFRDLEAAHRKAMRTARPGAFFSSVALRRFSPLFDSFATLHCHLAAAFFPEVNSFRTPRRVLFEAPPINTLWFLDHMVALRVNKIFHNNITGRQLLARSSIESQALKALHLNFVSTLGSNVADDLVALMSLKGMCKAGTYAWSSITAWKGRREEVSTFQRHSSVIGTRARKELLAVSRRRVWLLRGRMALKTTAVSTPI